MTEWEKTLPEALRKARREQAENLSLEGAAGESMTLPQAEALQRRLAVDQLDRNVRGSVAASKPASKRELAE